MGHPPLTSRRRDGSSGALGEALAPAYAALDAGQVQRARELALAVANGAHGTAAALEAHALACLAHCDRVASRLRRASEASRRAVQIFEQIGDVHGEAHALTTLAHVSMLLGRNEEAVEAALLAVRLGEGWAPQQQTVLAHNCLGLAYSWSGDHDRADVSLDAAVDVARRCVPPISAYQPRLNQVWVEASRLLDERYQTGAMKSLRRMAALMDECGVLERAGHGYPVLPGLKPMARTIALASWALLDVWQGDLRAAPAAIDAARNSLGDTPTWLDAFVCWCAAELHWARGEWQPAEAQLTQMREVALSVEHEQLACRAHLLLAQVFELQGKHAQAHDEQRALRSRTRRVAADGLRSRESIVSWQLGARHSEQRLQRALQVSKQFERWSLEDALTGIANRRHFEQSLTEQLPAAMASGLPLAVAMVDVNSFKAVNDGFTHRIGDRVLKTIAGIIGTHVRGHDLPARWGGDEFVILFHNATVEEARKVCERIQRAVASFDWESVAPGLRMTVSIGVSKAHAGDTPDSVVHRSDQSMYQAKPVGH
jgi:diguanylate cyclase (GGDEF)-like protein